MASPIVRPAPAASAAPAGSIPIRTVPHAAVEALVARLVASGAVAAPAMEIWL